MEKLQVSRSFVIKAYNAACSDWKNNIELEFPELISQLVTPEIEKMQSYKNLYNKSIGYPITFSENCVNVSVTTRKHDCLFAAWDFVKEFLLKYPMYTVLMTPDKIILKRIP